MRLLAILWHMLFSASVCFSVCCCLVCYIVGMYKVFEGEIVFGSVYASSIIVLVAAPFVKAWFQEKEWAPDTDLD